MTSITAPSSNTVVTYLVLSYGYILVAGPE